MLSAAEASLPHKYSFTIAGEMLRCVQYDVLFVFSIYPHTFSTTPFLYIQLRIKYQITMSVAAPTSEAVRGSAK